VAEMDGPAGYFAVSEQPRSIGLRTRSIAHAKPLGDGLDRKHLAIIAAQRLGERMGKHRRRGGQIIASGQLTEQAEGRFNLICRVVNSGGSAELMARTASIAPKATRESTACEHRPMLELRLRSVES